MECVDLEALADPLVDGELAETERAEARAHLGVCPGCASRVASLESLKRSVRQAAAAPAPGPLRSAVRARVAVEAVSQERAVYLRPALAFTAAAAAVTAGFLARNAYVNSQAQPLIAAGVNLHTRRVPRDIETRDLNAASDFVQRRVSFNPSVPYLGLPLLGATVTDLNGRTAAQYEFEGQAGRRVSLIVFPDSDASLPTRTARVRDRDVSLAQNRGYNVAMFRENETVYMLTSDLGDVDILELLAAPPR